MGKVSVLYCCVASLLVSVSGALGVEVEPELVSRLADSKSVPVIIHLKGKYDLSRLPKHFSSHEARVKTLTEALMAFNRKSSARVMRLLDARKPAGSSEITPLWIINAVRADVSPETVQGLMHLDEIQLLQLDRPHPVDRSGWATGTYHPRPSINGSEVAWGVKKLGAPALWQDGIDGKGVVVAVMDTGINFEHPDLKANVWINPGETGTDEQGRDKATNGIDDDKNGYIDDVNGWNFIDKSNVVADKDGHGSMVSGIIAGDGSQGTVTGVAPKAKIMVLRNFNDLAQFESRSWEAEQYALKNGARVLNMSQRFIHGWKPKYAKWRQAGEVLLAGEVIHVNAAGNEGTGDVPHNIGAPPSNPPAWFGASRSDVGEKSSMISVGAIDESEQLKSYSSTGPVTWEDIEGYSDYEYKNGEKSGLLKPEVCSYAGVPSTGHSGRGYSSGFEGTSAASPHVAGVVALLLQVKPKITVAQATEALQSSAVPFETGHTNKCGAGRVDAVAAVKYVKDHF